MIKITTIEETSYIHKNQLPELERIIRFYSELDINIEGIETITYLLKRINELQNEISNLKTRLGIFESVFIWKSVNNVNYSKSYVTVSGAKRNTFVK